MPPGFVIIDARMSEGCRPRFLTGVAAPSSATARVAAAVEERG